VLSCRCLRDELATRPEESYRLWCAVVCDLENLKNEETMTHVGSQRHSKKKKKKKKIASTDSFSAQKFSHNHEHTQESSVLEYDAM